MVKRAAECLFLKPLKSQISGEEKSSWKERTWMLLFVIRYDTVGHLSARFLKVWRI